MTVIPVEIPAGSRFGAYKHHASVILTFVVFGLGALAVYRLVRTIDIEEVLVQFRAISPETGIVALAAALAGYGALIGYDWSALRYIGKKAPLGILAAGSFTAYALSNTIGLAVFSGGAVRYRFYRGLGLSTADIAIVSSFCALSFALGFVIVGLAALVWRPDALLSILAIAPNLVRLVSLALLVGIVSLAAWSSVSGHAFRLGRYRIGLPRPGILAGQVLFSLLDILFGAATLYLLLPADIEVPFSAFTAIFATAAVIAVVSHVPGGVGVFESLILASTATRQDLVPGILAALIGYRIIYYIIPFGLALLILTGFEILSRPRVLRLMRKPAPEALEDLIEAMRPALVVGLSVLIFGTGSVLLLNGLLPMPPDLVEDIAPMVPVGLFELSNVVTGAVGGMLIILSTALYRRIHAAFWITLGLLAVGMISLLVQRLNYDLATGLGATAVLVWFARHEFYRSSRLTTKILSLEWVLLAGGLVLVAVLLLMFAHKDAALQYQFWWQFALDQNAPRALRILGTGLVTVLLIVFFMALRPARSATSNRQAPDWAAIRAVIAAQDNPEAWLVLTGDKSILMSADRKAFIMYARHRRSLVALGDPIGDAKSALALIDDFIDLANREKAKPAFYQAGPRYLAAYIDFGFHTSKLGEEAVVPLPTFSLSNPQYKGLRQAHASAIRAGLSLEVVPPPHGPELLAALKAVSDDWLATRPAGEPSFAQGRFGEAYLQEFPIALVRQGEAIIAFAAVLGTPSRAAATLDLLRHVHAAPAGTTDFLVTGLMEHLKKNGFATLSLGMAPLAGLEQARHKSLWDQVGSALSRLGDQLSSLAGLRADKDRFEPQWRSRYLASWTGIDPLIVAADVNALIGGAPDPGDGEAAAGAGTAG